MRQEYVFVPAKVKEVYLFYLLARLQEMSVRSAIIFASTCKVTLLHLQFSTTRLSEVYIPESKQHFDGIVWIVRHAKRNVSAMLAGVLFGTTT